MTKMTYAHALKGAAVAAGLAMMSFASPAAASKEIVLHSVTMDQTYWSNIVGFGTAVSNGMTFNVSDVGSASTYQLYGFCIDIFHEIQINKTLDYTYIYNKGDAVTTPATNFNGVDLTSGQIARLTALVNIGDDLHKNHDGEAGVSMQTAAIQSAIWETLNPGSVSLYTNNLSFDDGVAYAALFAHFRDDSFTTGDRIFTIVPKDGGSQSFAIGWPIDVPEPGTWALMLVGFGGLGVALRRQRALAA